MVAGMRHAIRYALNAIDEYLMGARIDWHDVRDVLKRAIGEPEEYSKEGVGNMWEELIECEVCGPAGVSSPATQRVLGHDACDQCAIEMEASLQIGPAIWIVEVSDGEEYEGYSDANWGTVDFGPYTLAWADREAAEAYAQRAGAEAREGFLVEVVGGDKSQALNAAGVEWVAFDAASGVFWSHDDAEGLRRLLGTETPAATKKIRDLPDAFAEIWACPECEHPVEIQYDQDEADCPGCGVRFEIPV